MSILWGALRVKLGAPEPIWRAIGHEQSLAEGPTPTSLFWGAADTFGGEDAARALKALLPRCELELLAGGGHLPWLDAPERAAAHVRHFMS